MKKRIKHVADVYRAIIKPEWKFQISEIVLGNREKGPLCSVAKLLFHGRDHIFLGDEPISAGLHMTLINFEDKSLFTNEDVLDLLIKRLNEAFQGKQIKIAERKWHGRLGIRNFRLFMEN